MHYGAIFKSLNCRARLFSGPEEYLEYLANPAYQAPKLAIFSDVSMPAMSGYELMEMVRRTHPHQRFVISTGSPEILNEYASACFYLTKPISLEKIEKVIGGLMQCHENGAQPAIIGCESIDDREVFCVSAWKCPRRDC